MSEVVELPKTQEAIGGKGIRAIGRRILAGFKGKPREPFKAGNGVYSDPNGRQGGKGSW